MAKSKGFFGLRTGSTKSLTFQILDGQQITKDRVYQVRNPRTILQQVQRIVMLTACMAYSHMKEIVDHSIEGVSYGSKTQQEFIRKAVAMLREKLHGAGVNYSTMRNFVPFGTDILAINAYEVSRGSLPTINCNWNGGIRFVGGETYADIITRLGLQAGDQLTILGVSSLANKKTAFNYCRIILQPQDEQGTNLTLDTPFLDENGKINAGNLRNENTDLFDIEWYADNNELTFAVHGVATVAGTVIASRKVDTQWLRSTQSLLVSPVYVQYSMADALARSNNEILASSDRYLNNSGTYGNDPLPSVKKITIDGVNFVEGKTYDGPVTMKVIGSNLESLGVEVYCGSNLYVPLASSDTELSYTLAANGSIRVMVAGEQKAQFNIHVTEPAPFDKIKVGGTTKNAIPSNFNVVVGSQSAVEITAAAGKSQADIEAANFTIAGTSQTIGNVTYSTVSGRLVAKFDVTWRNEGTSQIKWGSDVLGVIVIESDDFTPPATD